MPPPAARVPRREGGLPEHVKKALMQKVLGAFRCTLVNYSALQEKSLTRVSKGVRCALVLCSAAAFADLSSVVVVLVTTSSWSYNESEAYCLIICTSQR